MKNFFAILLFLYCSSEFVAQNVPQVKVDPVTECVVYFVDDRQKAEKSYDDKLMDFSQRQIRSSIVASEVSVRELMARIGVAGGVVFLPESDIERKYKFVPKSLFLPDVLDSVVKVEPEYRWENKNGVVNLFPSNKYPTFLDVVIPEFEVKNTNTFDVFDDLRDLPAFREHATALGYSNYTVPRLIFSSQLGHDTTFSVHCKNATVREILNEIVRAKGRSVWGFHEYTQNNHKYFDLWFVFG